jgi:hypothetical protein
LDVVAGEEERQQRLGGGGGTTTNNNDGGASTRPRHGASPNDDDRALRITREEGGGDAAQQEDRRKKEEEEGRTDRDSSRCPRRSPLSMTVCIGTAPSCCPNVTLKTRRRRLSMIWRLPIATTMRTTTIHYKMVEPAATAKGTVAMAAVAATKMRMRTNAPCHSHLRCFFHRQGCSFVVRHWASSLGNNITGGRQRDGTSGR